ncbi:MAG: pyridoxamine kinase [Clostridiales bacterium]|nr:pyridoxamine kinase [Bacillota bacterium]NLL53750.1 pyridoxamine kinase [Clostridiales bacterium]
MYKRILTVQDISCLGQCSTTVALPVFSACGHECCILPTALLSTHTGGFTGNTFLDLSAEMPKIMEHWVREGLRFDLLHTAYLGRLAHLDLIPQIRSLLLAPGGTTLMDPAMGDHGRLYKGFNRQYVDGMRNLCRCADVLLPNPTEASLLTGIPYQSQPDPAHVDVLLKALCELAPKALILLTGVPLSDHAIHIFWRQNGRTKSFAHRRLPGRFNGTGDLFSAAFTGLYAAGQSVDEAVRTAAGFTLRAIEGTIGDPDHRYGVKFEPALGELIKALPPKP